MTATPEPWLAVTLAAAAGWLVGAPAAPGRGRLRALLPRAAPSRAGPPRRHVEALSVVASPLVARAPVAFGALTGLLVLSGRPTLGVMAAVAAVLVAAPARRRRAEQRRTAARLARDVPRAAELIATCLDAGAPPGDAVSAVCQHLPGPVPDLLRPVAAALRAGLDPVSAWALLGAPRDDPLWRLGRTFARAAGTGAPVSRSLRALADAERARMLSAAESAARRAGVRAVGPLALCFLPAFVLLGVVPVVVSVAEQVLGGLG